MGYDPGPMNEGRSQVQLNEQSLGFFCTENLEAAAFVTFLASKDNDLPTCQMAWPPKDRHHLRTRVAWTVDGSSAFVPIWHGHEVLRDVTRRNMLYTPKEFGPRRSQVIEHFDRLHFAGGPASGSHAGGENSQPVMRSSRHPVPRICDFGHAAAARLSKPCLRRCRSFRICLASVSGPLPPLAAPPLRHAPLGQPGGSARRGPRPSSSRPASKPSPALPRSSSGAPSRDESEGWVACHRGPISHMRVSSWQEQELVVWLSCCAFVSRLDCCKDIYSFGVPGLSCFARLLPPAMQRSMIRDSLGQGDVVGSSAAFTVLCMFSADVFQRCWLTV